MEELEELPEAVVDSALVDEVVVVDLEDFREAVRPEASHLEVGEVPVVDFLVDVVRSWTGLTLTCVDNSALLVRERCTCKGCFGNNKNHKSGSLDISVLT